MCDVKGRMRPRDALCMVFTTRARTASKRGNHNSIYHTIARNLSENGGSVSTMKPAKESDPHLPQG